MRLSYINAFRVKFGTFTLMVKSVWPQEDMMMRLGRRMFIIQVPERGHNMPCRATGEVPGLGQVAGDRIEGKV